MKKITLFASLMALPLGIFSFSNAKNADAITNAQNPIVLELFTSQSCSSCPPADKFLGELATKNQNIIALSCHVTYWNHLHWKDTLAKKFCTDRQHQYVRTLDSRGPYTPQIVINGHQERVGNRSGSINRAIAAEAKKNSVKPIHLTLSENTLEITLPETPGTDSYALLLFTHGKTHHQDIPSGENKGRTVSYTNPVKNIISLGTWDGTGKSLSRDISDIDDAHGYVVLAQKNGATGTIIAAAQIKR